MPITKIVITVNGPGLTGFNTNYVRCGNCGEMLEVFTKDSALLVDPCQTCEDSAHCRGWVECLENEEEFGY